MVKKSTKVVGARALVDQRSQDYFLLRMRQGAWKWSWIMGSYYSTELKGRNLVFSLQYPRGRAICSSSSKTSKSSRIVEPKERFLRDKVSLFAPRWGGLMKVVAFLTEYLETDPIIYSRRC